LVLVARDVAATVGFYERVLGARVRDLAEWGRAEREYPVLHFGSWKVNVHPADTTASPRASAPAVGGADLCLRWSGSIDSAVAHLRACSVPVELGPMPQEGAAGWGASIYFRDPDGCLLELISYDDEGSA
jgi:catechol 2,3-dioxygenase-like lactoylglutathione lyase family enzyme